MEKREPYCTGGRNVNWCSLSGKHYGGSLKNKVLYIFIVYNILSTIYSVCVYIYIYIYIYTHTHTHTQTYSLSRGFPDGSMVYEQA